MKTMLYKNAFFIIFVFSLISCNNSNKNSKVKVDSDKMPETAVTQETADDLYIVHEDDKAVINSDCGYYLHHSDTPSGKLKKGEDVIVLDDCYAKLDGNDNIDIYIEIETLDKTVKGFIIERYLSYSNSHNELSFKNIPLTYSYYYTKSVEEIYKEEWLPLIYEDVSEEDTIKMMRWFFSPKMILISERHLVIGEGYNVGFDIYKILSIDKKNENTYLLKLLNYPKSEFEIVLLVDNDGITITQFINKNEIYLVALSERDLNIKYIPYNREKSEKIKKDVLAWCFEQFKILGIKNDKL